MAEALIRNGGWGNVKFKINGIVYCSFTFVLPEAENIFFLFCFRFESFHPQGMGISLWLK